MTTISLNEDEPLISFIVEDHIDKTESLICSICQDLYKIPVGIERENYTHIFCHNCLIRWFEKEKTCPICSSDQPDKKIKQMDNINNEINQLNRYCIYEEYGCEWIGNIESYKIHISECGYQLVGCPFNGCSEGVEKMLLEEHLRTCKYGMIKCQLCHREIVKYKIESHQTNKCINRLMKCEFCHKSMMQQYMDDHLEKQCQQKLYNCEFSKFGCLSQFLLKDEEEHKIKLMQFHLELMKKAYEKKCSEVESLIGFEIKFDEDKIVTLDDYTWIFSIDYATKSDELCIFIKLLGEQREECEYSFYYRVFNHSDKNLSSLRETKSRDYSGGYKYGHKIAVTWEERTYSHIFLRDYKINLRIDDYKRYY